MLCGLDTIFGFSFKGFREKGLMFITSRFECSFVWFYVYFVVIFGRGNLSLVYDVV